MQVTETLSDGLRRGFTVVVPAADIEGRRAAKLTELGRTLRLPGFRPGKVPLGVVRQRFGPSVTAEVLQESVDDATKRMLSERGLRPATQPRIGFGEADPTKAGADLAFTLEFELLPDISLPDFAAIALTRLRATPDAEQVDAALAEVVARNAELVDVTEDRGATTGDTLVVDYLGRVDGVAFPGGTGTDMNVELGGSGFIPGFAEGMEGLRPGETRTVEVTFPEDYSAKELAGKPASFEITAKALRCKAEVVADDAFAEKLGVGSLERLRDLLTQNIQRQYDQLSRQKIKRALLDALAGQASFAVPESMVEAEFGAIWQRVEADQKAGNLDAEDAGKDEATLRAEYRAIAERRVRLGLLLTEIGRVNNLGVTQQELDRVIQQEARRYTGMEQQAVEFFRKNPQAQESLRGPIFEDKVVDFVLELASVTEQPVSPEELAREEDAPAEAVAS